MKLRIDGTLINVKLLPRSKAKTAWGLLQETKRVMRQEPKRVDMGCFVGRVNPTENLSAPACGTVGCFAGWVGLLALGHRNPTLGDYYEDGRMVRHEWDDSTVKALLGPDRTHVSPEDRTPEMLDYDLRSGDSVFNAGEGDGINRYDAGTQPYANAVIRRIDRFMRRNAAALKRRKLTPAVLRKARRA